MWVVLNMRFWIIAEFLCLARGSLSLSLSLCQLLGAHRSLIQRRRSVLSCNGSCAGKRVEERAFARDQDFWLAISLGHDTSWFILRQFWMYTYCMSIVDRPLDSARVRSCHLHLPLTLRVWVSRKSTVNPSISLSREGNLTSFNVTNTPVPYFAWLAQSIRALYTL